MNNSIKKLPLFFAALAVASFPGLSEVKDCPTSNRETSAIFLEKVIREKIKTILESKESSSASQRSLQEMILKDPRQLPVDLERKQLSSIKIGSDSVFTRVKSWLSNLLGRSKEPEKKVEDNPFVCDKFNFLSTELKNYIRKSSKGKVIIEDDKDKIGPFSTIEIISITNQAFAAVPKGAKSNIYDKEFAIWPNTINNPTEKSLYSFVYNPKTNILTTSVELKRFHTNFQDQINEKPKPRQKLYKLLGQIMFDLATGEVSFSFRHSLGGLFGETEKWIGYKLDEVSQK